MRRKILVIDIGGSNVKLMISRAGKRKFKSGPHLTPREMVAQIEPLVSDWKFDAISIGFPSPVRDGRIVSEPKHLGKGWVRFDFEKAFGKPVRIINDAAMQALGSYKSGRMLFLGLGTGLGSALIVDGIVEPMELGHLPYKKATFEDYVGVRGLEKHGKKKWRAYVTDVVQRLVAALEPDEVVLGGGNVKKLKELPSGCRAGDNDKAFLGGFRLGEDPRARKNPAGAGPRPIKRGAPGKTESASA